MKLHELPLGTTPPNTPTNVTLLHHWLVTYRGGEKVLERIAANYPHAPIATMLSVHSTLPPMLRSRRIINSPLQRLPLAAKYYRELLPLHPWAFRRLKIPSETQLLISSDAGIAKTAPVPPNALHVCYCHSPPRYLWDYESTHKGATVQPLKRRILHTISKRLRLLDFHAAQNVNLFIANSQFVSRRIATHYKRRSIVVHPPVDIAQFECHRPKEAFHLIVSALVPYKRVDLAVDAYTQLRYPLVIIGDGPELKRLQRRAGPNVQFLGRQPFVVVKQHLERASAFIYPQVEDFGITAVEAQACGCPVIAFRQGGALETIIDGETGTFFDAQTNDSLATAAAQFVQHRHRFDPQRLRTHAARFDTTQFNQRFSSALAILQERVTRSERSY